MEKDSKIYVAGNSGLVGSSIVRKLKAEGYDNLIFTPYPEYDLRNQQQVDNFFKKEKPDYVFLAAAKVGGILANSTYPAEFIYDNLMIATNVIHASYKYGVKKLLNLGSSCIYPKLAPQPLKEEYLLTGPLEPTNEPYAIAKISAIKLCYYYNKQYGTNFISVMPTNLYGPSDNFNLETSHVLPAILRKMHLAKCLENNDWDSIRQDLNKRPIEDINGNADDKTILRILKKYGISLMEYAIGSKQYAFSQNFVPIANCQLPPENCQLPTANCLLPTANCPLPTANCQLTLWGTGKPRREFLYVDDLADAVLFLMNNYNAKDIGEFINIGTGEDITIKELAEMVKEIVGFKGEIEWDVSKPDGTPQKLLDVGRLNKLGWRHKTSLRDGIIKDYNWYKSGYEK
ncbi:MAG TPA: GDP-L-fucose synthase [Candidatus Marinimicrobia bacterium]|nr:GDP-L-fucose synthase [Candidatus Neomarinimicrobiota bacterium]HRU92720.1 GDP-L-fucose synthase [Candidatus Neomarinimicrobiota bacterium]